MHFSLELEQRRQYIQLQETTQVQVLRAHDKLDQVIELIRSLYLPLRHGPEGLRQDSDENMFNGLERLARFKALSITVAGGDLSCENGIAAQVGVRVPLLDGLKLAVSQLKFLGNQEENDSQRVLGTFDATSVWIEWKNYDPESTTLACRFIENRIARLTALLLKNPENPERLQLPASLGYVHDPDSTRFGLVFESPVSTDTLGSRSLYARLQTTLKPSLTTRLDIARRLTTSLKYLHVSRWLHKGLRSDNILFLTPSYTSWTPFCLSGFDYSRPADPDEATELPTDRREHDLYRHPDVQFDVPRDGEYGYEEKHDVYSLGVILMEIGLWQPIHQFLGLSLNQLIPRPAIRRARISLLKAESLTILESEAGARFSEAVRLCLAGDIRQPPGEIRSPGMAEEIDHPAFDSIDCLRKVEEILQGITV
ncbi:hypothetical protein GL218_09150 [Daldinia childiae]|uniref:uncharacterized protein n=1 Tax=Daldinia childiae TaxID=326645 RepID=UPI0014477FDD|nr:uncharacterized protein GL218_09150 [Daldinia childiae]KAF3066386.1 hypothetical protein GL218_09150 [Daldinia childiae]